MGVGLLVFFLGWFALLLSAWLLFSLRRASPVQVLPARLPRVSILVAARNEEATIGRCLASIRALNYPPEQLEILVGDDASNDRTAEVAAEAMRGFAGTFRLLRISAPLGLARSKANVLAHLTRAATADVFLLTDADIHLPRNWVQGLLKHLRPGLGLITGLTLVQGPRVFDQLQGLDWLLSLALVQVVSDRGQPVTTMGNNMLITREAYEAVGGYERLPFSVTEDYQLLRAVLARGFDSLNLFEPAVLAESLPVPTWQGLLQQRRRWLHAVEDLPWPVRVGLVYYAGYFPALAFAGWYWGWLPALGILAGKLVVQGLLVGSAYRKIGRRAPLHLLPLLELYSLTTLVGMFSFRFTGRPFEWKGRRYAGGAASG